MGKRQGDGERKEGEGSAGERSEGEVERRDLIAALCLSVGLFYQSHPHLLRLHRVRVEWLAGGVARYAVVDAHSPPLALREELQRQAARCHPLTCGRGEDLREQAFSVTRHDCDSGEEPAVAEGTLHHV